MKKLIIVLVMVVAGQVIGAPTIKVTNPNGGNDGFYATVLSEGWLGNPVGHEWWTFCIETNEYFYPNPPNGNTYYVSTDTVAWKGGINTTSGDPLDSRTAWLYNEFLDGNLKGADGNPLDTDNDADMQKLQNAIWMIEQEMTYSNSNPYIKLVEEQGDAAYWQSQGIGNIRVMNLWTSYNTVTGEFSGYAQDMLTRVPAPGALLLGSLGIGLVGWLRRRRAL